MKALSITKTIFLVIGLGLLVGAFFWTTNTQKFLKGALTANGTMVDFVASRSSDSTTYRPVVKFKTQNDRVIEFTSSTGSSNPSYSRGEAVEVLYKEAFPEKAKINGFVTLWLGPLILSILGSVFFLVGFSILVFGKLKGKKIEYLQKNGTPIIAQLQAVDLNTSLEVNGRSPFHLVVQWQNPATSEIHIFTSENIWFDPSDYIDREEIVVLVDKNNLKKYHVDISFLPKIAD